MVALALGEELESRSELDEALSHFEQAERLFPMERFKKLARQAILRVRGITGSTAAHTQPQQPAAVEADETLYVVSCTKQKVWDGDAHAPRYVPAKDAYVGSTMREWLKSDECRQARFWVILSAKYGFIDPDHPVGYYDVTFDDDHTGPLSLDLLRAQAEHQSCGSDRKRLRDFKRVRVCGSNLYVSVVRAAFMRVSSASVSGIDPSDNSADAIPF
jgi:hypothetical protein